MQKKHCVTVFCGRLYGNNTEYYQSLAIKTGRLLGKHKYAVATGGGSGQMNDVSQAAKMTGTDVYSIQLELPSQTQSAFYTFKESYKVIDDRQKRLITIADAYIILPGGLGTLYEFVEILLKKTLGIIDRHKPIILIDNSYYEHIEKFLVQGDMKGFFTECATDLCKVVDTPEQAIHHLNGYFEKH